MRAISEQDARKKVEEDGFRDLITLLIFLVILGAAAFLLFWNPVSVVMR